MYNIFKKTVCKTQRGCLTLCLQVLFPGNASPALGSLTWLSNGTIRGRHQNDFSGNATFVCQPDTVLSGQDEPEVL